MSRDEKIRKLANAIRAYRGLCVRPSRYEIQWKYSPMKPSKRLDIVKWISSLGLPVSETEEKIRGFQSLQEMSDWIKAV